MITLLTDFGLADYFVPAVKGVILSINPAVQILDLTHDVPAHDVRGGAFTLAACCWEFPPGTIHLAVVDPGVGSERRAILVEAGGHRFVGPDNGLFSFIYARHPEARVFHLNRSDFFRPTISPTFHGRDLFAPVAAHLSLGVAPSAMGDQIKDFICFDLPQPTRNSQQLIGHVLHIDRFGNCITNLTERDLPLDQARRSRALFCGRTLTQFGTHFAEAVNREALFAYPGSAGYWEVALWCASAAEALGARVGDQFQMTLEA